MASGRWSSFLSGTLRVADGAQRAAQVARLTEASTQRAAQGLSGIGRQSAYARHRTRVGGSIYHSDHDKEAALAQLDQAFTAFRGEVEPRASAIGAPAALAQWWTADVLPALDEWRQFREHESTWFSRLATEWPVYDQWRTRLRGLRALARVQGFVLRSPEPAPLPETLFEHATAGRGTQVESAITVGRMALYTALTIAGVLGLRAAWREIKAARDGHETSTREQSDDEEE